MVDISVSPHYEKVSGKTTLDNEASDMETQPNISYQTVVPAAKNADVTIADTTNNMAEKFNKEDVSCKRFICILVTITFVTLISLACLAVLFIEVFKITQLQQISSQQNESVFMIQLEEINKSLTSIQDQITTLSREETENSNAILMLQQQHNELLRNALGQFTSYPAASCAALPPSSPSGYYWVSNSNDSPTLVYCTMSCGTLTGGWTRVAFLDRNRQCPRGLIERIDSPNIHSCVRNEFLGGCSSVELFTHNTQYTRVCGRITAYQVGTTDGFNNGNVSVDGVILTHGSSRQHIWTFAAGSRICSGCRAERRQDSVGNDFFCDSGNPSSNDAMLNTFYGDHPLWDGAGCVADNPYFFKTLTQPTTDNIEMRVCRNADHGNEDIAIEMVEIYVQ